MKRNGSNILGSKNIKSAIWDDSKKNLTLHKPVYATLGYNCLFKQPDSRLTASASWIFEA